jgi:TM2 domain-containing membrane protein YozV
VYHRCIIETIFLPEEVGMADAVKKDKKWVAALIISILIGSLGIDRFFMGYVGLGILKLITFGGFGIWWLIDVILIASKHDFAKVNWVE